MVHDLAPRCYLNVNNDGDDNLASVTSVPPLTQPLKKMG